MFVQVSCGFEGQEGPGFDPAMGNAVPHQVRRGCEAPSNSFLSADGQLVELRTESKDPWPEESFSAKPSAHWPIQTLQREG